MGSAVLVGSLSHLGRYDLESYKVNLVRTVSAMVSLVGLRADLIPYVPIPRGRGGR